MRPVFLNPHRHRIFSAIVVATSIITSGIILLVLMIWRLLK